MKYRCLRYYNLALPFEKFLILSDFDGTLTGENGKIPNSNLKAIEEFKLLGGHFTFSTGRLPSVMKTLYPDFRSLINAPAIMSNGAILYDPISDTMIKEIFFDGVYGRAVLKDVLSHFPSAEIAIYADSAEPLELPPDEVKGNNWRKVRLFFHSEEETLECRDYVRERYSDLLSCNRSWSNFAEITSIKAQKGSLIPDLKRYLSERGDIIACCIGDYENDISMLQSADISFCPQNATHEVKKIARHTVCHCFDGAIAELISILKEKYI